ncbi:MAG TPA: HAD family phosphatase [Bryobacteraceae bacterium]|nr:HAD family phosphatase [Bryobacteraceae bacterium]
MPINSERPWADGITGIIFDLDGVLIQSRGAHARAFQEVLEGFGVNDFHYDDWAGWRTPDVFRSIFAARGIAAGDAVIADCSRRKSQRARDLVAADKPIEPDCIPVVRQLAARYRLALASSGSRKSVDIFLDTTGLRDAFRATFSGDDVRMAKPDPEIFSKAIESLETQPSACAVVEDAVAGIQAARRAGAYGIGFTSDNAAALSAAGADRVVASLRELAGLLECA